jgi:TonB family protein
MSAPAADRHPLADPPMGVAGWSRQRWIMVLLLAISVHLALASLFSRKQAATPRPVTGAPQFHLTESGNEFLALTDPTLFAQPHEALDFFPTGWRGAVAVTEPPFNWTEPPPFLPPDQAKFGADFTRFVQSNRFTQLALSMKPEPAFAPPAVFIESALPRHSALELSANIAARRLNQPAVPTLPYNDILKPSRVQLLVNADGSISSAVLLESSEWGTADQKALELARALRFRPAQGLTFGELTFTWHSVPTTNAP